MKKISSILCVLLLSACANMPTPFFGEKITRLEPGMSKEMIFENIGRPDSFEVLPNGTVIKYLHRLISGWEYQYTDYSLFFDKNNKLVGIKTGNIIDNTANVQNALNSLNQNINTQQQLQIQRNQQLINSLNQNKAQKVILCKQGDFMCY